VDPDSPDLATALSGPDQQLFKKAMQAEIQQLEDLHCWDIIAQSKFPHDDKVIQELKDGGMPLTVERWSRDRHSSPARWAKCALLRVKAASSNSEEHGDRVRWMR
jgi:hypothetical protein